jgi:hypothetical protein
VRHSAEHYLEKHPLEGIEEGSQEALHVVGDILALMEQMWASGRVGVLMLEPVGAQLPVAVEATSVCLGFA